VNLRPYDGVERRFKHSDVFGWRGRRIVATLLGLERPPRPKGLRYDLSFYSGGIGVYDRLAISLPADQSLWSTVLAALGGRTPEMLSADPEQREDFRWLIDYDADDMGIRCAAADFINAERVDFQPDCSMNEHLHFVAESDVNGWAALWGSDTMINYLGFRQG